MVLHLDIASIRLVKYTLTGPSFHPQQCLYQFHITEQQPTVSQLKLLKIA